jgi:hypothetical protein
MKGAEEQMLEVYDKQTQEILDNMRKERDIIRSEAANILKLKEEMKSGGLWWSRTSGDKKKGGSFALTLATFLAWTFGFAAANEVWTAYNSDGGIASMSFATSAKTVVDVIIALVSTAIASKKTQAN